MHLVRDLLDKPIRDRNGREMGRVDGVVLSLGSGKPPRVVAVEIGPAVLADRVFVGLGAIATAIENLLGVGRDRPTRIGVGDLDVGEELAARLAIGDTGAASVENALRKLMRG